MYGSPLQKSILAVYELRAFCIGGSICICKLHICMKYMLHPFLTPIAYMYVCMCIWDQGVFGWLKCSDNWMLYRKMYCVELMTRHDQQIFRVCTCYYWILDVWYWSVWITEVRISEVLLYFGTYSNPLCKILVLYLSTCHIYHCLYCKYFWSTSKYF